MDSSNTTLLFIYGTLKRGHERHSSIAQQQFIGDASTEPQFRMVDCGRYPGLIPHDNGLEIHGELWLVNDECLSRLDEIEGLSTGLYARLPILLRPPYQDADVQCYFYQQDTTGFPDVGANWMRMPSDDK